MNLRENYQRMSLQDLVVEESEIASSMLRTKKQLNEAKAHRFETGECSDPIWYARATHAAKLQGRLHQVLLQVIAEKRAELRAKKADEKNENDNFLFIKAAKLLLSPEQYKAIWRAVNCGLLEELSQ
jgi:hypothetical protein